MDEHPLMPVYIDNARIPYRRMIMSHMWADTAEELHAMAEAIGMKREWFQTPGGKYPASFPHYDVCLTRRQKALELGAIDVLTNRRAALLRKPIRDRIIADPVFAASWRYDAA